MIFTANAVAQNNKFLPKESFTYRVFQLAMLICFLILNALFDDFKICPPTISILWFSGRIPPFVKQERNYTKLNTNYSFLIIFIFVQKVKEVQACDLKFLGFVVVTFIWKISSFFPPSFLFCICYLIFSFALLHLYHYYKDF